MNKKVWGLILALCLIVPVSLSAEVLDFSIGATAQYKMPADSVGDSTDDLLDVDNYRFGAEARVKFLLIEAADTALIGPTADGVEVTNLMTAGLSLDLMNLVRLGVGLGPEFTMFIDDSGNVTTPDGDGEGGTEPFNFADVFMKSNCTYKVNADILLGGLTLSANYTVPSVGFNIDNIVTNGFDVNDLAPQDFDKGRFGISVLISLI
ncbi:MAG: hypothetical protein ACPKOI_03290 [Pleomorphochaeta sp.]